MKKYVLLAVLVGLMVAGAQAQMVGATNGGGINNSEYHSKGHYLRLEAGYPNLFTVSYGYQITPWIMFGGGGGFGGVPYLSSSHYDWKWAPGFPLFTEFIFSTPKRVVSFLVDFKLGVNVPISEYNNSYGFRVGRKYYSSLNLGLGLRNFGFFMGASTNSVEDIRVLSFGVSYNIPLKVY